VEGGVGKGRVNQVVTWLRKRKEQKTGIENPNPNINSRFGRMVELEHGEQKRTSHKDTERQVGGRENRQYNHLKGNTEGKFSDCRGAHVL